MKNGNYILKTKEESNFRTGHSKFTEDHAFGSYWAKLEYWKRPPILILEKTPFAYLGTGFADFVYFSFKEKLDA